MNSGVQEFQIPIKPDTRGTLGILEFSSLNFVPQRIYWLADIPQNSERGHHAHKSLNQLFVLMKGNLTVEISRGSVKSRHELTSTGNSLSIPPGLWRKILNASPDAVLLVLCDQPYDEEDYIRDFDKYIQWFEENHA
jgi:dTDP-4-dehydrorhamnose 3,5-epimerase-like enzyme